MENVNNNLRGTVQIGTLDTRIEILSRSVVRDDHYGESATWTTSALVWAKCIAPQGFAGEEYQNASRSAVHRRVFVVRTKAVPGLAETMRIRHLGIEYDILALDAETEGRKHFTRITAEKRGQE